MFFLCSPSIALDVDPSIYRTNRSIASIIGANDRKCSALRARGCCTPGRETARRDQMNFAAILFPRVDPLSLSLSEHNPTTAPIPPFVVGSRKTKAGKYLRSISPVETGHAQIAFGDLNCVSR